MPIRVKVLNDAGECVQARISKVTPDGLERSAIENCQGAEFTLSDPHEKLEITYANIAPVLKEGA